MATTYSRGAADIMRPYGKSKVKWYPEAASQTFKAGYPVILDASATQNRVRVAADNPTAAIVGVAAMNASGVTGQPVAVWIAQPELKFLVTTFSTDVVDFADIGAARALQAHATLATWVVDTSDAGNDSVVVEAYMAENGRAIAAGDAAVYAIVHFDPKATIFGAGT